MKFKKLFLFSHNSSNETPSENTNSSSMAATNKQEEIHNVSPVLSENLAAIKNIFRTSDNFDFIIREFKVKSTATAIDAFLIFYDGLSNKEYLNRDILTPLMTKGITPSDEPLEELIHKTVLTQAPNTKNTDMQKITEAVGFGNCAVFVDGCSCAFVADIKGWSSRSVGKPVTEALLTGPQEAFCESVMPNIALIRKILKDPDLIAENIPVGTKSKTPCALMYINGITNTHLVDEARRRLKNLEIDYIYSSTDVEMLIEDNTFFPLPQILKTERPDRAASMLADGKVIIIIQGSPFVLIIPATVPDLVETAEDSYVRIPEANFMRLVRIIGCLLALLLPGFFISTVLYHHESIPTDLILAIEASREQMPFPIVAELIVMILAFELIKEASIRVPDPIGSTLGIVGGLILGQSAVSANIASPLLIIIVSISALGAFAAPSTSISRALSVLQFVFIISGTIAGFLGIAFTLFLGFIMIGSGKSFGIPYSSTNADSNNFFYIPPIWKREIRPRNLKTQNNRKQPHISRKWKGENDE